jgi:sugar porter (SP) family MFS transporter
MLGVEAIPAAIYLLMVFANPESPRWLALFKKDRLAARKVLAEIYPEEQLDGVLAQIKTADNAGIKKQGIFCKAYSKPILLAFLIAFFNQLSGINFVIYYAPRIFNAAGFSNSTALLSTAGIGLINLLVTTLLGMTLIDRFGRRMLIIIGSIGYITSLALLSYTFYKEDFEGVAVPLLIFAFIASHAVGQGSVIWVFISEIFPNSVRASGQALGTGTHWVFAALITVAMPYVLNRFDGGPIFAFFAVMMVLQLLFALFLMPETKGVSLEDLDEKM